MPHFLMRLLMTAGLAAAALPGCSATGTAGGAGAQPPLADTGWVLTSLPGRTLLPSATPTLVVEGGRVAGSDGCNRFGGPLTTAVEGARFEVGGGMIGTRMACPEAVMQQASAYTAALQQARRYQVVEGRLQLLDAQGAVLATFAPQARSLAATSWKVNSYNNGRQAVVSLATGTAITMNFDAQGRVSGSAGCNNFTGTWSGTGSQVRISQLAATRRMCVEPKGVMEQEAAFLMALESATTARFEGNRLELRTATDALAVMATR
jgi:heat shock protein HslJ